STTVRSPAPEAGVSTNFTTWASRQRVYVVDGAHYTERLFNCKPLPAKKMIFFTSGVQNALQASIQGSRRALYSRKFPV
ncbi:hypothetical protein, partial [Pseudomonas sp. B10]|uniref:hypothetical protein n=1 Tax=Pseudomonas sp. B10 TaxID=118613 RepID=UPI001C49C46A